MKRRALRLWQRLTLRFIRWAQRRVRGLYAWISATHNGLLRKWVKP